MAKYVYNDVKYKLYGFVNQGVVARSVTDNKKYHSVLYEFLHNNYLAKIGREYAEELQQNRETSDETKNNNEPEEKKQNFIDSKENIIKNATQLKENGVDKFKSGMYVEALKFFNQAQKIFERDLAEEIKNKAEKIAALIKGKIPVIYTSDRMEAVAVRFRQQINENSKFLAWHHVIPEMNHNELVGWKDVYDNIAVIYFRNKDDFRRNAVRMDINKEVISKYCDSIIEIYSKGQSLVEKSMYFVHLGDWVSWYLAELRGVDALEVNVIDHLKGELAKLG